MTANRQHVFDLQQQVDVVTTDWQRTQALLVETHNLAIFLKARFDALTQAVADLPAVFQASMQSLAAEQVRLRLDLEKIQQAARDHRKEIHELIRSEPVGFSTATALGAAATAPGPKTGSARAAPARHPRSVCAQHQRQSAGSKGIVVSCRDGERQRTAILQAQPSQRGETGPPQMTIWNAPQTPARGGGGGGLIPGLPSPK